MEELSDKSKGTTFILSLFLGVLGVDRMYVGKIGTGVLKLLLTFVGIGFIWWIIDLLLIIGDMFTDSKGRKLK